MNHENEIQLLVDGELTAAARSRLLLMAEQDPTLWRSIAICFLENQTWRDALAPNPPIASSDPIRSSDVTSDKPTVGKSARKSRRFSNWMWLTSLAASLIVGLLIGGSWPTTNVIPSSVNREELHPLMQKNANDQVAERTLASAIERSDRPIPPGFRRQLLRAGYDLTERRKFELVSLPIGGNIEIPIRHVEIKFVGLAAYQ